MDNNWCRVLKKPPKELFPPTKGLAANQELYNGFLAAGLIWTFFIQNPGWHCNIAVFFLSYVVIAGVYGTVTADKKYFLHRDYPHWLPCSWFLQGIAFIFKTAQISPPVHLCRGVYKRLQVSRSTLLPKTEYIILSH
ncbi:DUF1304 domain-containing protein [Niabella ginsenosidivorans]|uniref:DUF1304 domain-containing protein n=1 Tax=Niabella ginsenosidivorans TaxID=1176587 RepID=UPI001FE1FFD6|nr:DUF1304 domain-containing protein [Niabella ginsenosidivorans]